MGIEQTRNLHSERTAARNNSASQQILPCSTGDRKRVYAWMFPEPAVFVFDKRL
jgi:hypothetical protein